MASAVQSNNCSKNFGSFLRKRTGVATFLLRRRPSACPENKSNNTCFLWKYTVFLKQLFMSTRAYSTAFFEKKTEWKIDDLIPGITWKTDDKHPGEL